MTKKDAFEMGFRHIADLAMMNRIAEMARDGEDDADALALMEAWREGALAARALLGRKNATLQ